MKKDIYTPDQKVLEKYASVLVNFALNSGKGLKKGEAVYVSCPECAKPLLMEICKAITERGGHYILNFIPDDLEYFNRMKHFYEKGTMSQIEFFPDKYYKSIVDSTDHTISIISENDKKVLEGVDPKKIMQKGKSMRPYMEWRTDKENQGKFTWTLALYGTRAMADEAGLSEKEYWQEIIQACFLDKENPIAEWKKAFVMIEKYRKAMSKITKDTERFHMFGEDCDIWFTVGSDRKWLGGSGRNIPSFEVFTSPDWRGTNGWIRFNQPLYRYGNIIKDIYLEFKNGKVVKSSAKQGEKVLKAMIATENADKVGEWSLTDNRLSRITKFMAETLFDENVGGPFGNTHIALGNSYVDTFDSNISKMKKHQFEKLGYNYSSVHTDIMSTTNRTVVAHLKNGKQKIIYKDGQFQF